MDLPLERLEEIALNAWPALQQVFFDGWVLRTAEGFSKRANSVNALYPSSIELAEKISYCERYYGQRGLPALYRLTAASTPPHLDQFLAELNYRRFDPTLVMGRELPSDGPDIAQRPRTDFVQLDCEEWLAVHRQLKEINRTDQNQHQQILQAIPGARCLGVVIHREKAVACGLGVVEGDTMGIFDLVTAQEARRQGFGTRLMQDLFAWGRNRGVLWAYLQVMEANAPARRLYGKLGFEECYSYWYRAPG
jgi:GNAT superfamily N-acetyltransferase